MNYNSKRLTILFIIVSLIILACAFFVGCSSEVSADENRMIVISYEDYGHIVYDRKTKVEYWRSSSSYNYGSLTLLVDENGNPLIYKGE